MTKAKVHQCSVEHKHNLKLKCHSSGNPRKNVLMYYHGDYIYGMCSTTVPQYIVPTMDRVGLFTRRGSNERDCVTRM